MAKRLCLFSWIGLLYAVLSALYSFLSYLGLWVGMNADVLMAFTRYAAFLCALAFWLGYGIFAPRSSPIAKYAALSAGIAIAADTALSIAFGSAWNPTLDVVSFSIQCLSLLCRFVFFAAFVFKGTRLLRIGALAVACNIAVSQFFHFLYTGSFDAFWYIVGYQSLTYFLMNAPFFAILALYQRRRAREAESAPDASPTGGRLPRLPRALAFLLFAAVAVLGALKATALSNAGHGGYALLAFPGSMFLALVALAAYMTHLDKSESPSETEE